MDLAIHLLELLTALVGLATAVAQALADTRGRYSPIISANSARVSGMSIC